MPRQFVAPFMLLLLATPLAAQSHDAEPSRAIVQSVETIWRGVTTHVMTVADETAEADYAYRPNADVRTIGEMIGHLAGAQYLMCAAALGDPPRDEDAVERSATSKLALMEALEASTAYCDRAYAQADADLYPETELFGSTVTRFYALTQNATHNAEHYGNLVTYLRMRGIVPPSSR